MDILAMEPYQSFSCIGSACPITCCANWSIRVDKNSAAYYRSVEGPFGDYLRDNLEDCDNGDTYTKTCGGRCAFLDQQNLCMIYKELGRERLCYTCTVYPRQIITAGSLCLVSLSLSCPEAVRLIFSWPAPMEILAAEQESQPDIKPDFDWNFFTLLSKAFLSGVSLLQARSLTIAHRQRLFLLMCRAVDDALAAGNWQEANEYLNLFGQPENCRTLQEEETDINLTEKIRLLADTSLLFGVKKYLDKGNSGVSRLFTNCIEWLHASDEHLETAWKRLEQLNQDAFAAEQEQFMVCLMFRHWLAAMKHKSLTRTGTFVVLFNQFKRLFPACWPHGTGDALPPLERRVETVCHLSRMLEHNAFFLELFHRLLDVQNYYELETLYQIVS